MGLITTFFSDDIILDEAAFQKAAEDLAQLSTRLNTLNQEIEDLLTQLATGFDTAAGRKFVNSCSKVLRQPMSDQRAVLDHISKTLEEVRALYKPVFENYDEMNTAINNYNHDV